MAASGASARVATDPCHGNPKAHVSPRGVHCGAIFEIPGHRTWEVPSADAAPSCESSTQEIPGIPHPHLTVRFGDWDYWTQQGEWITWNHLSSTVHLGQHNQVINIRPHFHNWGSSSWPMRIYFRCVNLP
jgi:hypothetical protein